VDDLSGASFRPTGTEVSPSVAAAAIHDGHALRAEVSAAMGLGDEQRLREEDPFTAEWAEVVETRLIGSAFALRGRPQSTARAGRVPRAGRRLGIARVAGHALRRPWSPPRSRSTTRSTRPPAETLAHMRRQWGRFVVLDLHSYNHRRDGPTAPPADPATHPEVNIGTSNMDRRRWAPVVDGAIAHLRTGRLHGSDAGRARERQVPGAGISPSGSTTRFPRTPARSRSSSASRSWMNGPARPTRRTSRRSGTCSRVWCRSWKQALKGMGD
jgi:hypothetical protein